MSKSLIRKGLEEAVEIWANAQTPKIPVAWENMPFTPPANGARYAEAFLLPIPTASDSLGREHRRYGGFLQVNLHLPKNKGPGAGELLVASLAAAIKPQTPIITDGLTIYIVTPMSDAAPIPDEKHSVIPVNCRYRADTI